MQSELQVEVHELDQGTLIAVNGELDLASGPLLQEHIDQVLRDHSGTVLIDLRRLEFMDSTGLSVMVKAHHSAEASARRLVLVKGPPQVQRLLELTGLAERLEVVEDPAGVLGS